MKRRVDKPFLIISVSLLIAGFLIFISASTGLLTKGQSLFTAVAVRQAVFGLLLGVAALCSTMSIPYQFWRKFALWFFLFSLLLTAMVFVPGIGIEYGGAKRWISVFDYSFQPSELLKIATVIYLAAWLSKSRRLPRAGGIVPLLVILTIVGAVLIAQPDTDTFLVIAIASIGVFLVGGTRLRQLAIICLTVAVAVGVLSLTRPYVGQRIITFFNPSSDALGSGYQLQQSLIAIGSGGLVGKGFGRSTQKWSKLPEPVGDSIFAVAAEEFGFLGGSGLVLLFTVFALRAFKIAARAPDQFARLLVVGIAILIVSQSFVNIASMVGLIPLAGIPLFFVSHGGSALFVGLGSVGIILNVSKRARR